MSLPSPARLCVLFLAALLAVSQLASPLRAGPAQVGASQLVENVTVRVDCHWPAGLSRGWVPVHVEMRNDGDRKARVGIELGSRWANQMSRTSQSSALELEAGEARRMQFLTPIDRNGGTGSYELVVSVGRDRGQFPLSIGDVVPHQLARSICLLGARDPNALQVAAVEGMLPQDDGSLARGVFNLASPPVPRSGWRHSSGMVQAARVFAVPLEALPRRTEAWSSVDTVVIDASVPLPGDRRWGPLLEWLRGGGQIAFVGERALEAAAAIDGLGPLIDERNLLERTDEVATYRAGFGTLSFHGIAGLPADTFHMTLTGVGALVLGNLDKHNGVSGPAPSALAEIYRPNFGSRPPWREAFPTKGLPLRPVVAFLFLFSLVVGPLNVVYARKKKRPSLLFVSVPILSLFATVVIVVFGALRQGFSTEGFAHSVAIVDQTQARATTIERREMFVGRGGNALRPAPGTTVLVPDDGETRGTRIVRGDGNQFVLAGDFLPVRSQTRHLTVRDAPTRLRLDVQRKGERTLEVTNGLGVDLVALEVRGEGDEWYTLDGVLGAGDKVLLRAGGDGDACLSYLGRDEPLFRFVATPEYGYSAIAKSSPTADDASVELDEIAATHAVVGYLDPARGGWTR